jgi:oligopeptidase B
MKLLLGVAALFIVIIIGNTVIVAQETMKAPVAKKVPKVLSIHGYEITDNYAWMRDRNKDKDPAIIQYLKDNNDYTMSYMGRHQPFVDALYKEMLGRIKQDDTSVPYRLGAYWYFNKTEQGKQYPVYLRSKSADLSNPEILLDQNEMAKGHEYFAIGDFAVSDDGNFLAYAVDVTGYRQYLMHIKNLKTGETMADTIERVTSVEWSNDGKYLFVGQEDPISKRTDRILRHDVGTTNKDAVIYQEDDPLFNVSVGRSRDKKMLFIAAVAKTMREFRYLAADDPKGQWNLISVRRR